MSDRKSNSSLALSLIFAVFLWGGTNTGTKFVVATWPPLWTGSSRFLCAGLVLLGVLRWTPWLGSASPLDADLNRRLWWRGGLSLAVYIVCFNWALRYTAVSHVALYLGAAPVWALLWEGREHWLSVRRLSAALLALGGVMTLFWPALRLAGTDWRGEVLGLACGVLWTNYGRQCGALGRAMSGAEISAHTMWRAGALLSPLALIEICKTGLVWRTDLLVIHAYCILAGGVAAFALWNRALRYWPPSQVLLFNNLVPLSTMGWARVCLREPVTPTFWLAMLLIGSGVVIGQASWGKRPAVEAAGSESRL